MVNSSFCCNSLISSRTLRRSFASRFESGSSKSRTSGSSTSALATATRCCCPPDSSLGNLSPKPERLTNSKPSSAFSLTSAFESRLIVRPYETFCITVICGKSAYDWKTMLTSRSEAESRVTSLPPIKMLPSVDISKPAISLSVVVFPQPDGPSKVTSFPRSIVKLRSRTACTSP